MLDADGFGIRRHFSAWDRGIIDNGSDHEYKLSYLLFLYYMTIITDIAN